MLNIDSQTSAHTEIMRAFVTRGIFRAPGGSSHLRLSFNGGFSLRTAPKGIQDNLTTVMVTPSSPVTFAGPDGSRKLRVLMRIVVK